MSREINYVRLDSLVDDEANPKAHNVEVIDESVGRFGLVDLIVQDGRTGKTISGHGRTKTLRAMRSRGESPPEGVQVDEDGEWLVPVVQGWSSRTDLEARAALIALNRTTELGGWVDESLLEILDDLAQEDDGFLGVGFSEKDLAALDALVNSTVNEVSPASDEEFDDLIGGEGSGVTLTIENLTNAEVTAFRSLPGESDAERLRGLLDA